MLAPPSADAKATIAAGREAWARVREIQERERTSFADWVAIARALAIGTTYNRKMGRWLRKNGLDGVTAQARYRALMLLDNLPAVEKWRNGLSEVRRRKLNHPGPTLRAWRRSLKQHEPTPKLPTGTVIWPKELMQAARRGLADAIERYGSTNTTLLARARLVAALPTDAAICELADYQPKRCATPSAQSRPISPALAVMHASNH